MLEKKRLKKGTVKKHEKKKNSTKERNKGKNICQNKQLKRRIYPLVAGHRYLKKLAYLPEK